MSVQEEMERLRVRRAAEWYELFRSAEAGDADREDFGEWLAESSLNSAAYYSVTVLARETREAAREAGLSGWTLLEQLDPKLRSLAGRAGAVSRAEFANSAVRLRAGKWAWGLAASLFLAAGLAAATWLVASTSGTQRYVTGVGEERTLTLADGSTVYMNAASSVSVHLTRTARELEFDGEGFFQVAHDARRPFSVRTPDAAVRAVGTSFNVTTRRDGTRVAVIEGKVRVSGTPTLWTSLKGPDSTADFLPLSAGEAARVSSAGSIERAPPGEAAKAVAWREHLVIIDGMALEDAIQEFNTYQRVPQLRLEGVPRMTYHYSGAFDAKDPASFAEFLGHEQGLVVLKQGDEIVIRAKK